ncbi:MAG: hypothetical protein ACLTDR_13220 [Adlercreutzia equolifaciens]
MDRKEIVAAAEAYWDEHRDAIVADIAKLVEIPSTEDLAAAAPGAPYGPGPAAALDAALEIAEGMGMTVTNCEGISGLRILPARPRSSWASSVTWTSCPPVLAGRSSLSR